MHPFFVRMIEYHNRVLQLLASPNETERAEGKRLQAHPPPDLIEEACRLHDALPEDVRRRNEAHRLIYGITDPREGIVISHGQFVLGWLAWNRFGRPIVEIVEGDAAGDEASSRQLASITKDYQAWRYGKLDPNMMRFKFDEQHNMLLRVGLDLGLESLSEEELADCFDALCKCGKRHTPDNLRKLRTRLLKTVERLTPARARSVDPVRRDHALTTTADMAQLISHVQIEGVRTVEASMRTSITSPVELDPVDAKIGYTARVTQVPSDGRFTVKIDCAFEVHRGNEDKPRDTATADVAVHVSFELTYRIPAEMTADEDQLAAFARLNGVFNAWPYFREFVHASLARMGLPPFLLPVYRLSSPT